MFKEDAIKRKCKQILSENGLTIYEFKSSLFNLQAVAIEHLSTVRRIRFMLEIIRGGFMDYYLVRNNSVVGHCVITPGGRKVY